MDYNELLFAAEVRRQAIEMRSKEWAAHSRTPEMMGKGAPPGTLTQELREWESNHPLEPYLIRVAGLIRDAAAYLHGAR